MARKFQLEEHIFRSPTFKSVVEEAIDFFTRTPVGSLPPRTLFIGGGVYALYYTGKAELYGQLGERNSDVCALPIYVGKAVPPGWRTARIKTSQSPDLCRRLSEHARNIKAGRGIQLGDFKCRFIVLDNIEADLVVPVEAELIRKYRPIWNTVVDGFGNHDPGKGRYDQAPSEWDVLHPGREWARRLKGDLPVVADVIDKLRQHLSQQGLS